MLLSRLILLRSEEDRVIDLRVEMALRQSIGPALRLEANDGHFLVLPCELEAD